MNGNVFCRIAPFALYMVFIALDEGLRFLSGKGILTLSVQYLYYFYPLKALSVALLLFFYRKSYAEIDFRDLYKLSAALISIGTGIVVFVLWINMDFPFAIIGSPSGFNPNLIQGDTTRIFMTAARLSGAVLVVPVMEELFWRSFLIRYVVDQDFSKVSIGFFTWPSFLITVLLFGFEHNLFLAGMMAGIAYNILLYYTRSLSLCIVSHAVTNLFLGVYVISSGKWSFW